LIRHPISIWLAPTCPLRDPRVRPSLRRIKGGDSPPFVSHLCSFISSHQTGAFGASRVPRCISFCMPWPVDSAGPPHPRPSRSDASVLPSVYVKTLGVRNWLCRSCISTSGSATSPTAYRILCVRLPHILFAVTCSSVRSTLDTGGRLPLTRLGLSPCKIHRAWPGAITSSISGARLWRVRWMRMLG